MTCLDLTEEQLGRLFATVSAYLDYQHRLIQRLRAAGFPEGDPLHRDCRRAVLALRELYLDIADLRRKGASHQAIKRARAWPPL